MARDPQSFVERVARRQGVDPDSRSRVTTLEKFGVPFTHVIW